MPFAGEIMVFNAESFCVYNTLLAIVLMPRPIPMPTKTATLYRGSLRLHVGCAMFRKDELNTTNQK